MASKLVTRLVLLFFIAQLVGILILSQYINFEQTATTGITTVIEETYIVPPPQIEDESYSFISIILAVIFGTVIVLLLIKYNLMLIWKIWFFTSISIGLIYAFSPFVNKIIPSEIAIFVTLIISCIIAYFKIFRANYAAHTIGEIFVYGGLAALFVPVINLTSAIIMFIVLAAYDYYMVNRAGHMVTLANASIDSQLIAGLYVGTPKVRSYNDGKPAKQQQIDKKNVNDNTKYTQEDPISSVMVGGGDIAFSLFFAGAVMKYSGTIASGLLVAIGATAGLILLFAITKRGKFYPAIPFVGAGCFIALGIILLLP